MLRVAAKNILADFKSQFIEMFGPIDFVGRYPREKWSDVVSITNGKDHKSISGRGDFGVYGTGGRMMNCFEYMCEPGTIIMGRKGTIDKPYVCNERCWIVDTAFGINPKNEKLLSTYLYYYIKQIDYSKLNKAAILPSVTKGDLLNLEINIPPATEQKMFVELTNQIDKSKFEIERSLNNLKKIYEKVLRDNF